MKRFILLTLFILTVLSACGENAPSNDDGNIFGEISNAASYDAEWIFLPEEASVIRTEKNNDELKVTFKGCEFNEINAFAEQLFEVLTKERGCVVYDAINPISPSRLNEFKKASLDLSFAGRAYCYYYKNGDSIFMLTIYYYGCAGGKYGNGQSVLSLSDVTKRIGSLIKE